MEYTLGKSSNIWYLKSKFFIIRAVTYFSFLLFPIWIQKSVAFDLWQQSLIMIFYILFMMGQWYLLGKEVDHRLKIYIKTNSSIDRVIYRLLMGFFFLILYFNLLSFLPSKWIYNQFWVTWGLLGLFYSWPTRGKIIRESVSTQFGEFKFLDSFERTLLALTVLMFVVSIPEVPLFTNKEALKLYFDPNERFNIQFWNFLTVNYFPFKKYPDLLKTAWWMHFYTIGVGFILLTLYGVLRYFVSRRLSLLGTFAFISSWSISKYFVESHGIAFSSFYSLLLFWTFLWASKSSTYRAGLFTGLVVYWGTVLDVNYGLWSLGVFLLFFLLFFKVTRWYRFQFLKYMSLGIFLGLMTMVFGRDSFHIVEFSSVFEIWEQLSGLIQRKAFFILGFFGIVILLVKLFLPNFRIISEFHLNKTNSYQLLMYLLVAIVSLVLYPPMFYGFGLMWVLALLSLFPLELLFQKLSHLRSSRNIIYAGYIIIILLDSHFEGRIKILYRIFE